MTWTVQTWSDSGSFGAPDGTDVHHCSTKADVEWVLTDWSEEHPRMGSGERDAHALVWKGTLDDVTDQYPDYQLRFGPRMGIQWDRC